jgi:hypothetical protein
MSIDIVSLIDNASYYGALAILLFAAYRGFTIGRALPSRVYRNRAFWIAVLCVAIFFQDQIPDGIMVGGGLPLFQLTFFIELFVLFVFIDSTALVALELDFFHRNTLRWRKLRPVFYPLALIGETTLLLITYASGLPSPPSWATAFFVKPLVGAFFVIFGYAVVAMVVAARRTQDRTLRRHVMLLGLFFATFIATTFMFNFTSILLVDLLNDLLVVLGYYAFYRAVMSLSPVGRVEKPAG